MKTLIYLLSLICLLCCPVNSFACACAASCSFTYNSTGTSVSVTCTKDLSNVVLNFCSGGSYKFDNLNVGKSYTFSYQNKQISKTIAKAGCSSKYKSRTCLPLDCLGVPGGSAVDLGCGCNLPGPSGCDNKCGSTKVKDCAGVCGGSAKDLGCGCNFPGPSGCDNKCGSTKVKDCAGVCGGSSTVDSCGVCDGSGPGECGCDLSVKKDCAGVCDGTAIVDSCGVCEGSGPGECGCDLSVKKDCFGICGGSAVFDICGVCGGDGSSCINPPTPTPTPTVSPTPSPTPEPICVEIDLDINVSKLTKQGKQVFKHVNKIWKKAKVCGGKNAKAMLYSKKLLAKYLFTLKSLQESVVICDPDKCAMVYNKTELSILKRIIKRLKVQARVASLKARKDCNYSGPPGTKVDITDVIDELNKCPGNTEVCL